MRDSGFWSLPRGQGLLDGGGSSPITVLDYLPIYASRHQEPRFTRHTPALMEV